MKKTQIVYENDEILVINKDAGVSVQGGAGIAHPLDEELSKQMGYKIHLVHRLDKETSGLMVVAKTPAAAGKWISLIAGKKVKKEYTAISFGKPSVGGKKIDKGTLTDKVTKAGKEMSAVTNFQVEKNGIVTVSTVNQETGETVTADLELSQLHLTLGTGRMHQIRIHLAKAGAPIAGDDKHGNFKLNKIIRKVGGKTLCLASTRLTIPGDGENKSLVFEAELPEHMKKVMALLT